jgi:hypothetical protein
MLRSLRSTWLAGTAWDEITKNASVQISMVCGLLFSASRVRRKLRFSTRR